MQRKWNTEHWTVTFGELSTERAFCLEMRSRKLCGCSVFFLFFFSSRRKLAARLDRTEGASDSKPDRVAGKSFPRFGCWARTRNRQVASPQKIFVGYSAQIGESCAPAKRLRCGKGRVTGPPCDVSGESGSSCVPRFWLSRLLNSPLSAPLLTAWLTAEKTTQIELIFRVQNQLVQSIGQ